MHHLHAGEWQGALLQDLGLTFPRGVLHGDNYAACARYQVHGAAHSLHHFAGDHPICEIPCFIYFHRAKHAQINVAASDHGKGIGARKICRAGHLAHGFFAGINQVGIFLPFDWIRTDPQHAVFALKNYVDASRNVVRH